MLQSTYKEFHFKETALLKVHNGITFSIDQGKVTIFTLLDLSASFDTIDHNVLIERLSIWNSISSTALAWISSHLSDRPQTVNTTNCFFDYTCTSCGIHQSSWAFALYTTHSHNLDHLLCVDDTQVYISLGISDASRSLS